MEYRTHAWTTNCIDSFNTYISHAKYKNSSQSVQPPTESLYLRWSLQYASLCKGRSHCLASKYSQLSELLTVANTHTHTWVGPGVDSLWGLFKGTKDKPPKGEWSGSPCVASCRSDSQLPLLLAPSESILASMSCATWIRGKTCDRNIIGHHRHI